MAWLVCMLVGGWGEAGAAPARTLRFDQLSVEHGLAQESVLAIAQDAQGFMWFGSQSGLSRYDGYRAVVYKNIEGDPASLADNWVGVLHVDRGGQLWVGTDNGLDRFDSATQSFVHYQAQGKGKRGNGSRHINAIVDDGVHGFWIGTADGLQHFDLGTGAFRSWHHEAGNPDSLVDNEIKSLALDAQGRLWIGTVTGLDMLAPGGERFEHFVIDPSPASKYNLIHALLVDREQNLWIGTRAGAERWRLGAKGQPPVSRQRLGPQHGFAALRVSSLYQDIDGTVWLGSNADGLLRWQCESDTFQQFRHQTGDKVSVADNQLASLFRDRAGTLWVGTWYNGVSRADLGSGGFSRMVRAPGDMAALADKKVRALADAGAGKLWLATSGGLKLYDTRDGSTELFDFQSTPGVSRDEQVTSLYARGDGALWVGGSSGLHRFDLATRRFSTTRFAVGDPNSDTIRNVAGERGGKLWVSTRGGVHHFDPASGKFSTYRHDPARPESLADNTVRPVLEDSKGRLWIGTFHGLDLFERATGTFRHYRHDAKDASSLSHDEVHYLHEDKRGVLWVGTANGLNRMDVDAQGAIRFRRFLRKDGMADDAVASILGDDNEQLWLSTNSGITRLDMRSGQFRNYDSADGTAEGSYFDGAALRAEDGTMYFGGFNGMTAFVPAEIHDNRVPPLVAITELQVFNKHVAVGRGEFAHLLHTAIDHTRSLTLTSRESVFSLEFAALHFAAPQRNMFAYRLEGFDQDWVMTDAGRRFATYTNLDPGEYVFRVKAANKDGVWNETGTTLAITILPPTWKTWWFRTVAVLLLVGAIYGAYRQRMGAVRRQQGKLEKLVSARTAEVSQKNLELQSKEIEVRAQADELALANASLTQNEESLRLAKRKAEDATRQKSEFLANMSHEMRTPLAGVIGMLGFALRDGQLHEATREQILRGQANAQSLLAIINDLLDFSKIEAGKLTMENIDFALGAAIDNVASLFGEQAAARSIGFAIDLAPDLPGFVVGDPTRLRQVLVNLVGNAFKFTQRGGVRLRVERCGLAPVAPGARQANLIRFTVSDSGIGIEADAMERLFQKFEQADASTTRRYGGTGLGLAICRQLVELMGGDIAVASVPGQGSTFQFTVPLADGVAPLLVPQVALAPHSHQLRVLCAEDFPTNQIIIRVMLEDLGHRVEVVANGALAVAACTQTRYDLVLMDGRMPEMDGATATRLIRAGGLPDQPVCDQQVMIVALTANASDEDRSRYLGAGMDDFLSKPVDEAALHCLLGRAIARQLARGHLLPPLPSMPPRLLARGQAELDALFGVAPAATAPPAGQGAGSEALRRRLRRAFAQDLAGRLAELDVALAARDSDAAGRLLHGFKGSAAYLDEAALHLLCTEMEAAADGGHWARVAQALPRLHALLAEISARPA